MKKEGLMIAFAVVFLVVGFGSSSDLGSTEWNATLNETGYVTDYEQIDYSIAEFDVVANVSATQHWAEVSLNTSEIDFGKVERGNLTRMEYKIWARGRVDIEVTPMLENPNDEIFSNLYLSRTPSSNFIRIGEYSMRFNLTADEGNWLGIGSSSMEPKRTDLITNGRQYIRLDLTSFNRIIPFDEQRTNKVKFVITPIWSSVEPIEED
jgi:hypothetical protein